MWRAPFVAALLWIAFSGLAHACLGTNFHRGVIYDEIPWNAAPDALVLRVEFSRTDVERIAGPSAEDPMDEWLLMERIAVEARVLEVVRGTYDQSTIRIAIGGSSCHSPFIFGRRGLVIGALVTPDEGQARYDAAMPEPRGGLRFSWPFNETILDAITETRDDRNLRHAGLTRVDGGPFISGDYDGDGHFDTARFFEDMHGVLHVGVQLGARRQNRVERIWGGDIASFPFFTFRTVPPGVYLTACEAYGPDCGGEPDTITLPHDGIIVEGLEDHSRTLYYWSNGEFKNLSIRESPP